MGGFWSMHSHGVRLGHNSTDCKGKKNPNQTGSHVKLATWSNPVGPGMTMNKGWDNWLMWHSGQGDRNIKISEAVAANSICITIPPTCSPPPTAVPPDPSPPPEPLATHDSAISGTGASRFYLTPKSPCANINTEAHRILVGTSGVLPHQSSASFEILISNLPYISGHLMPHFHHNLMDLGPLCDW